MDIDAFDRAILQRLQEDGRISNQELAASVNLSPSPCLRRVRRLEDAGIIDAYVTRLNGIYERNLDNSGITTITGAAKFVDGHTIAVGEDEYTADRIVIATGGRPIVPDVPGAENGITSDGFFELEERPQRVLVVGSGYIAVELAGVFNGLGSDVQLVVRKDRILRGFDIMLSELLMEAICKNGCSLDVGVVPAALEKTDDGLMLHSEDGRSFGPFDAVLWAIGREPNSDTLDLEKAGVERDDGGYIPTDLFQQTNVEHIFALGDVTGRPQLTPVAIAAGPSIVPASIASGGTSAATDPALPKPWMAMLAPMMSIPRLITSLVWLW